MVTTNAKVRGEVRPRDFFSITFEKISVARSGQNPKAATIGKMPSATAPRALWLSVKCFA